MTETVKQTALYDVHVSAGAKMVPFAGHEMPVSYPLGIMKEHLHTREKAGLFDVSHMGQIRVAGNEAAMHLEAAHGGSARRGRRDVPVSVLQQDLQTLVLPAQTHLSATP